MDAVHNMVEFETSTQWAFYIAEDQPFPAWGGNCYKSVFARGERLQVPREIAEARQAAGLGRILNEENGGTDKVR